MFDVILDCYTDEPSGLGAPPYLSVHSRYLAGALRLTNNEYYYITIDDLRFSQGEPYRFDDTGSLNKRVINTTINCNNTRALLQSAKRIFIVFGCFVKYEYVSCEPPKIDEVVRLLSCYSGKKVLFYCLGINDMPAGLSIQLSSQFNEVYYGNTYNYVIDYSNPFEMNYGELSEIASSSSTMLEQLTRPVIIELESMNGCNHKPGCTFCIECQRNGLLQFRQETDIIKETSALYAQGVRHFRIGRQPNFYAYEIKHSTEKLLSMIRSSCPDLEMLHIDNVNPRDVVQDKNSSITKAIVQYCTSGNIAPFGIESFDVEVRNRCNLNGTIDNILSATQILNTYGNLHNDGELPLFLPGYNFIYGLNGQNENTLRLNLKYLSMVFENNLLVRRTFVRKLTSPFGTTLDTSEHSKSEFSNWCEQIENQFSLPMLKRVYPIDSTLRNVRVEMVTEDGSILRKLGTCSERILIPNNLGLDRVVDIRVIGYINHRTIKGELI